MIVTENCQYQVLIPGQGMGFDILSADSKHPSLISNIIYVTGRYQNQKSFTLRLDLNDSTFVQFSNPKLNFQGKHANSGIEWFLTFDLNKDSSFVMWKLTLSNRGSFQVFIDKIVLLDSSDVGKQNILFSQASDQSALSFFSNGWQSWSNTAVYKKEDRMHQSRLGFLQEPMVLNPGTPRYTKRGKFSSDFFGILGNQTSRTGLVLGFLSQKDHYGSITADLDYKLQMRLWANGDGARLDPGASISTDWAVFGTFNLSDVHPLDAYTQAVANEHGIKRIHASPAGWCSWYAYYQNISNEIIRENFRFIQSLDSHLALRLVQIDDGFQAQVGDWMDFSSGFSNGMSSLAKQINTAGYTAGLWLAPFIVHPSSRLAHDHSDWLLRNENGGLVRTGFVWNSLGSALDLTIPAALDYACSVLDTAVHGWGFPYIKLDFLYAAALKGSYRDPTCTRAQVLRKGMQALRQTVGEETFLLGCGGPLGSMIGLVQAMRIGADVSSTWTPSYFRVSAPFKHEPHMPCARNAIQNTLTRSLMHRCWWINDPDCLLVRYQSKLSLDEIRSLATVIGLSGGSMILSEKMKNVPVEQLDIAASLLPPIQQPLRVLDWIDAYTPQKLRIDFQNTSRNWFVIALFNWTDRPREISIQPGDFKLPNANYWIRSFWDNRIWYSSYGENFFKGVLPPHSPLLLSIQIDQKNEQIYLGSNLHISQGMELIGWEKSVQEIKIQFGIERAAQAKVDLYLPFSPSISFFNDQKIEMDAQSDNCFRFSFNYLGRGILRILK